MMIINVIKTISEINWWHVIRNLIVRKVRPWPRPALYLTYYQTKFHITSWNAPNFFNCQVALFFIKYWNSVLEIGKIASTFCKKNSRLIGWLVLLSPGQIYSLDSIAKSRKYIPFVLREWDSLPEKQSVCFDLTSNTSPAIVIDSYNLKNSRNLFIYKIFLMILCLCYQRKGDLLNDFLVWS